MDSPMFELDQCPVMSGAWMSSADWLLEADLVVDSILIVWLNL
ncbi:hypothetical protein [Bradyrhizobium sp. CB2312]|nr:hypothetical protein [Bradyrhizobium sp. CB2312]WFU68962.1 hypothetical protein QA642_27005 [Bradyrhizobium sp. CB2312]